MISKILKIKYLGSFLMMFWIVLKYLLQIVIGIGALFCIHVLPYMLMSYDEPTVINIIGTIITVVANLFFVILSFIVIIELFEDTYIGIGDICDSLEIFDDGYSILGFCIAPIWSVLYLIGLLFKKLFNIAEEKKNEIIEAEELRIKNKKKKEDLSGGLSDTKKKKEKK